MMKREALLLLVLLSALRPHERSSATAIVPRPVRLEEVDDWDEDELLAIGDVSTLKNILKRRGKNVKHSLRL